MFYFYSSTTFKLILNINIIGAQWCSLMYCSGYTELYIYHSGGLGVLAQGSFECQRLHFLHSGTLLGTKLWWKYLFYVEKKKQLTIQNISKLKCKVCCCVSFGYVEILDLSCLSCVSGRLHYCGFISLHIQHHHSGMRHTPVLQVKQQYLEERCDRAPPIT